MSDLEELAVGATTLTDVEATLSFLGKDIELETELFVARLSDKQAMVTTNGVLFVSTEDLGVNAGVDKLMELAKLPGITRTVPVSIRLVFDADDSQAQLAPSTARLIKISAVEGDAKAGKKAFRRCSACHSLKEGDNKVGPSLYGIVGQAAGAVSGFKYSKAMAESGLTWDVKTLSAFLTKPKSVVKGTSMQFPGLKKEADVVNVIAYIQSKS